MADEQKNFVDLLPEGSEYRTDDTIKRLGSLESVAKHVLDNKRYATASLALPKADDAKSMAEFEEKALKHLPGLRAPAKPGDYPGKVEYESDGRKVEVGANTINNFRAAAHEAGLSEKQFRAVAAYLGGFTEGEARELKRVKEGYDEFRLREGGDYPNYTNRVLRHMVDLQVPTAWQDSFKADKLDPDIVGLLDRAGAMLNEGTPPGGASETLGNNTAQAGGQEQVQRRLDEIMGDPRWTSNPKSMQEVTALYGRLAEKNLDMP